MYAYIRNSEFFFFNRHGAFEMYKRRGKNIATKRKKAKAKEEGEDPNNIR